MTLGLLPPLGGGLSDMAKSGQDVRFIRSYLQRYVNHFSKVYYFTYNTSDKSYVLPQNCFLVTPKVVTHRYLYSLLLPFLEAEKIKKCHVIRCFQLSSTVPAIIAKFFFGTNFVFNYNYDYKRWAKLEGKCYLVPMLLFLEIIAFKTASYILVSDQKMWEYASKFVSPSKLTLITNGVEVDEFQPKKKIAHKDKKVVLSIGRLEPQKNYKLLIQAMEKMKSQARLLLIGKGSQKDDLISQAKELGVSLDFIGVVPHDKLRQVYNAADIYVQPSLMEAPVKTLLEAMSCELPCIGTKVAGIETVINNNVDGLLCKPEADHLAAKIEVLLRNPGLAAKIGKNARRKIIEKYNLNKILNTEISVLKKI